VAHVHHYGADQSLDNVQQRINLALQDAVARHSGAMLGVHLGGRTPAEVMGQIRTARVWGVILDAINQELLGLIQHAGIPAVMVNAWSEGAPFDAILQDNYLGGFLAARHLIERGHKRIAWFGRVNASCFSRERLAGATAAMTAAGLDLPARLRFDVGKRGPEQTALSMLAGPRRPEAVLALWTDMTLPVVAAARKLKLALGRDLDVVGWAIEECYESYRPRFDKGRMPPMITWKTADLARMAIARLIERRDDPDLPLVRINVATRLREGDIEER